ncbi:zinc finger protein 513a isoform X2 [Gadus macrocephalus]|uniref:zinc finger protein 513a isoform X2 n=2 Tax=Gadus macrocephalus TaxID=80720 RepID=UPI0028CB3693|nr:zinc finger protein 513a isoform X2 [Gadus macrocephalus]
MTRSTTRVNIAIETSMHIYFESLNRFDVNKNDLMILGDFQKRFQNKEGFTGRCPEKNNRIHSLSNSPTYSHLSMDSEAERSLGADDNRSREEGGGGGGGGRRPGGGGGGALPQPVPAFPPYLSCRGCGQLRDEPLGPGIDLVGPYCLRCCKASRELKGGGGGGGDYCSPFGGGGGMDGMSSEDSREHLEEEEDDEDDEDGAGGSEAGDKAFLGEDGLARLHSCHLCGFSSRYANHVKRHMKTHNGEKPYNCPLCTYASAQLVNLQRHLRIHTGEKPYKCDRCSFACSSLGNLKRHQRMHFTSFPGGAMAPEPLQPAPHGGQNGLKRPGAERGPRAGQEEPGASSRELSRPSSNLNPGPQNSDYLSAFNSLKGTPPLPPPLLASPNPNPPAPNLRPSPVHLEAPGRRMSSHTVKVGPPAGSGGGGVTGGGGGGGGRLPLFPYTCRLCGVVLEDEDGTTAQICAKCTLDMLTKDASSSSPGSPGERSDKVYTCAACPFLTHYPNHLARHMKTHSGEKPYRCPQCEYASAHFDNLKRHHRVHTGEKPYKCHLCDYACGNLANLKRHQRVHSGAKPFQCAVCSYSCNQSMNLKRHMLRHTGEKPYKCRECGYTTGHWDNYKRHQKKHGLATDGWVKVQPPGSSNQVVEDDDDDMEEGMSGGSLQAQRKEAGVDMQYR